MSRLENVINLLGKLKDLKRSGWVQRGIVHSESVADHTFGVAFLTLLLAPADLDKEKCLKMAVLHDVQEILSGDVTPYDGVSPEEKAQKEKAAVLQLSQELDLPDMVNLFEEYESKASREARFVKDIDRLEAVLQAKYYDDNRRGAEKVFSEFYEYASDHICQDDPVVSDIFKQLERYSG